MAVMTSIFLEGFLFSNQQEDKKFYGKLKDQNTQKNTLLCQINFNILTDEFIVRVYVFVSI